METGLTGFDEIDIEGARPDDDKAIIQARQPPDAGPHLHQGRAGHAPRAER
jgi:hypothetical protein